MNNKWGWGDTGEATIVAVNGKMIRCYCNRTGVESSCTGSRIGTATDDTRPDVVRALQRRLEILVVAHAFGVSEEEIREIVAAMNGG
jgi:hypothetical protein